MKLNRTKNATKGIVFGVFLNIYKILIKFAMRTVFIYLLGVEYLGLDGLFTSILKMLSLAELGVGSALTFSMYKPIADNDENKICALMKLYKIYYRIIGFVILVVGMVICPFIPYLIKSSLPDGINIFILYLMNLFTTVISYWLFAYKSSIIYAHQRNDIISKITIVLNTIQFLIQILLLYINRNFYVYVFISLIFQIVTNIVTAIVSQKMYPNYVSKGTVDKKIVKDINRKIKDLFTSKVGAVVYSSADTIVISSCLGLTTLAIYENYNYIITAVMAVINVIFLSCTAGIGNSIITENSEKNYSDLKKFTFIIIGIITICTCCILCSVQDFMNLWVGKDLLLDYKIIICLCIYFYIYEVITIFTTYKDAAGMWHRDRYRALISSIANLCLNLVLVRYIGLYGVILSSIISLVIIAIPWLLHNIFTELFKGKLKNYCILLLKYILTSSIIIVISSLICNFIKINYIINFILKNILCVFISILIWVLVFRNTKEIKDAKNLLLNILKGGLK